MANSKITRRHFFEIEKISEGQYPSKKDIEDYLFRNGHDASGRTIEKDFEKIRNDYGIEIRYNKNKNGYSINEDESINIDSFIRFLEIINTADILSNSIKDSKLTLSKISFDSGGGFKNIKALQPLLKAVMHRNIITFNYKKFQNNELLSYCVEPYLLKEYQNRWYVVGVKQGTDKIRTFGIDRIENLKLTTEIFNLNSSINPIENFNQTIGLVYSDGIKAQTVILSFTPEKGNYIKTLPLHTTQEILTDNNKEFRISLYIIPNNDLTELILKHGDSVKVIEPDWLVNEVKDKLYNALQRY